MNPVLPKAAEELTQSRDSAGSCRAARAGNPLPGAALASVNPAANFGMKRCGAGTAKLGLGAGGSGLMLSRDAINQPCLPRSGCPHAVTQVTRVLPPGHSSPAVALTSGPRGPAGPGGPGKPCRPPWPRVPGRPLAPCAPRGPLEE